MYCSKPYHRQLNAATGNNYKTKYEKEKPEKRVHLLAMYTYKLL